MQLPLLGRRPDPNSLPLVLISLRNTLETLMTSVLLSGNKSALNIKHLLQPACAPYMFLMSNHSPRKLPIGPKTDGGLVVAPTSHCCRYGPTLSTNDDRWARGRKTLSVYTTNILLLRSKWSSAYYLFGSISTAPQQQPAHRVIQFVAADMQRVNNTPVTASHYVIILRSITSLQW